MTRKAFSQYVPAFDASAGLQAAADELQREIDTRKRLYDRWLAEGKLTWTEADSRLRALMGAQQFLMQAVPADFELKIETRVQPF